MTALTVKEAQRMEELEYIIRAGWKTFIQVGEALREISTGRLYRQTHPTFEAYCQDVWGWTRQRASLLMLGAETARVMQSVGVDVENERQARALRPVAQEVARTPAPQRTTQTLQQAQAAVFARSEQQQRQQRPAPTPPAAPAPVRIQIAGHWQGGRWHVSVYLGGQDEPSRVGASTLAELVDMLRVVLPEEARR